MKRLTLVVACGLLGWNSSCKEADSLVQGNNDGTLVDLSAGLAAFYPFNGNAKDSSGQGHDGTNFGATSTLNRFGDSNKSFSFNGISAFVNCADILDEIFCAPVAKFSASGWAKTRQTTSIGTGFIIGKNGGGSFGPYQWSVTHLGQQVIAQVFFDTAAANYITVSGPMITNRWFHFVLVFDGSLTQAERLKLFIDGQVFNVNVPTVVGTVGTTTVNSQQRLTIGATHDANAPQSPTNFYDGLLDDIRIYSRSLWAKEVQALYTRQE